MKRVTVTIVIPAYNHEKYVGEAIRSVLDQTFSDLELIIINDGSTDHTEEEILKFKDGRIRYFSQENQGLSATLNRGIELARGEYFNFLPSDDAFYPEKLEVQLKVFEETPGLGVVFSYPLLVDAEGREIKDDPAAGWSIVPYETREEIFPALFERDFLSAPSALIRVECFHRVGGFDPALKTAQDYDMWMRILKHYDVRLIKKPLLSYRWHGENLTYQATAATEAEREKVLLKAYKNLTIDDIFPGLYRSKESSAYYEAYEKLAFNMERSGVPALLPISQIYRDMGRSVMSKAFDLPETGTEQKEESISPRSTRRIRVLMETISLDKGGMERVIFDLVKGLDPELFDIVVVAVERGGFTANRCKDIGVPVEILRHDKPREYGEILERYQIDLVVSHYSTFGAKLTFEKAIPTLSVLHNVYSWFPENILSDFRLADRFVTRYIAVSEQVRQYAHYRFNIPLERIGVIPNGIDIEAYTSRPLAPIVERSELGFSDKDYLFINVASISPPKGQNVILAALKKITQEHPNIRVLLVGSVWDEAYLEFLKNRVEKLRLNDCVRFIGQVEDVRPYLRLADAFLLTSFVEGGPLAAMEAMLSGLPVIAPRVGSVTAMLEGSGAGLLIENSYNDIRLLEESSIDKLSRDESPRNAEQVARAMGQFCKEKEFWRQAGQKGYERVVDHFNLQRMVRSYEKELLSLHVAAEKARGYRHLKKIAEQQRDLQENERTIDGLRSQIVRSQERMVSLESKFNSKINLLDVKIDSKYQNIDWKLDYVLARLSLKERVKGAVYRLVRALHHLVPRFIRERYGKAYRRVFLDKLTPADEKVLLRQGKTEGAEPSIVGTQVIPRGPREEFLAFKAEIREGLAPNLKGFGTTCVPGLVSVVLPVYNQAYLVAGSIESVLQQTHANLELIVVNDGSTDDIERVLGPYRSHPKVKILDQTNQKLPRALSNGFRLARGEFFTWTSADNLMGKGQLEAQVQFFLSHPDVQMVYANYDLLDEDGSPLLNSDYCPGYQRPPGSNHIHLPRDLSELNVIRNNYIGPCFMYRAWVGKLVGDYAASMFTMEDYDYWMTINAFFRIEHLGRDDLLYCNRVHGDSLTGRKKELKIVEMTDRLMEFEKMRRAFYREKFKVYLIGNNERLKSIKEVFEANGNRVGEFRIPSGETLMEKGKALGIWIASPVEKGFVSRVMRENPHAFFAVIETSAKEPLDQELMKSFGMKVSISRKIDDYLSEDSGFYAEEMSSALYPILCKANIELFRRKESFARWNP